MKFLLLHVDLLKYKEIATHFTLHIFPFERLWNCCDLLSYKEQTLMVLFTLK